MSGPEDRARESRPAGLTYHQVMKAGRRACWRSRDDEFVYLPQGITYYRSLRPDGPTTYGCSIPVQDRSFPDEGWMHEESCDCEFCSDLG